MAGEPAGGNTPGAAMPREEHAARDERPPPGRNGGRPTSPEAPESPTGRPGMHGTERGAKRRLWGPATSPSAPRHHTRHGHGMGPANPRPGTPATGTEEQRLGRAAERHRERREKHGTRGRRNGEKSKTRVPRVGATRVRYQCQCSRLRRSLMERAWEELTAPPTPNPRSGP